MNPHTTDVALAACAAAILALAAIVGGAVATIERQHRHVRRLRRQLTAANNRCAALLDEITGLVPVPDSPEGLEL